MTERRLPAMTIGFLALATFLALLVLLATQMREGRDPALGERREVASQPLRRVLVRRIVRRVEIVSVIPAASAGGSGGSGGAATATSAPTVTSSAPSVAGSAPAPAAAPAPVTRSS